MRILAIVSYKGTNYYGWQKQPNQITVQETIETVLSTYFNEMISIVGSGRTDAGVHAIGQRFHFDVSKESLDFEKTMYSLNRMLPNDIKIVDLERVDSDFHARYNAKTKTYIYSLETVSKDVFFNDMHYVYPYPFDEEVFSDALTHFIGVHNFKNFTSKEEDEDNFVREIKSIVVENADNLYHIKLKGTGFMRYMIRFIIGAALDVMNGKYSVEDIDNALKDDAPRKIFSSKAPACGLFLYEVEY